MNGFHSNLQRVFERDPDLLNGISDVEADRLRRDVVVRCVRLEPVRRPLPGEIPASRGPS